MSPYPGPRSVLVLDNASFHRTKAFLAPFRAAGIRVLFTPPYQPWFQPIESCFSKLKAVLRRRMQEWISQGLSDTQMIQQALASVTASDAQGWIRHSGYESIPRS
jgi:transposase